ncbi:sulfite exporter TauE/SafE family protein [Neptunicoccus sediminis]|uniref:sulfite exporter TauE/SafE family protein n=1 Tax=Neptunicoccus sediminis TaxID=1892596 RepID=UPI0009F35CAD|nr:sulfite exporter TauE/SafE family protein [Neptunicoccus sediminis]
MTDLFAVLDIGLGTWFACFCAVTLSSFVQRLSGQAFGIVAAPLIALVAPQFLPAGLLLLGISVGLTSTAVDISAINKAEIIPGFFGRALGAVLAAMVAAQITDVDMIAGLTGLVVLAGIALSLSGIRVRIAPVSLTLAGIAAGLMGTITAVGAPPMALLYQHEPAKRSRAMQNAFFFWGMCVSVLALAWQGLVTGRHLVFALSLIPAIVLGLSTSMPLAKRMERKALRPYALGLSALAATTLILRLLLV